MSDLPSTEAGIEYFTSLQFKLWEVMSYLVIIIMNFIDRKDRIHKKPPRWAAKYPTNKESAITHFKVIKATEL